MSTITAPTSPSTSTSARRSNRVTTLAVSAIVVIAAAMALTVWLLVQSPAHRATLPNPPLTNVQKLGVAGQGGYPAQTAGQQCRPAVGQRFC